MISSQGLNESAGFDVLNSQKEENSTVYQIPIRKVGFEGFVQPTDLPITNEDADEDFASEVEKELKAESFTVPKDLLDHLDFLIVKKKLPLRTLKFDIEFSKSKEEIAEHLQAYVEKSTILEETDLDKLFSFIGYQKEGGEKITPVSEEELPSSIEVKAESSLEDVRTEYINTLVPYLQKIQNDKKVYAKIMAELGGKKDMPQKEEPRELTLAREEYLNAKKEVVKNLFQELSEIEVIREKVIEALQPDFKSKIEASLKSWDSYGNSQLLAEALMSDDSASIEKIVDPSTFTGMRSEVLVENPPAEVKVEEKTPAVEPEPVKEVVLEEKPPVDISVAENPPMPQNTIPLEYGGKKLEIVNIKEGGIHLVKVVYDGKDIASGEITNKGPQIKIKKEYKSGFLLADTPEEKALKFAMSSINSIK